jgi:hypothetical protein
MQKANAVILRILHSGENDFESFYPSNRTLGGYHVHKTLIANTA